MAGDTGKAVALTATFPRLSSEQVRQVTQAYTDKAKAGNLKIWIYPSSVSVSGDCAVVVIGDDEEPTLNDPDPAYLLRQNGEWKVLLKLTNWKQDFIELNDDQKRAFTQLEATYKETRKRLRGNPASKSVAQ